MELSFRTITYIIESTVSGQKTHVEGHNFPSHQRTGKCILHQPKIHNIRDNMENENPNIIYQAQQEKIATTLLPKGTVVFLNCSG